MQYRKDDGDYTFGTGGDFYVNQAEAVAQAVRTRLALWLGDWFLDTSDGTPWSTDGLGQTNKTAIDAQLRARILGTMGVTSIVAYGSQFDGNSRKLAISATIDTVYGTLPIQETIG
ncbi:hypothetical protein [Chromobacterium violaceum]|uniref:hypothetical protein n=1 Tax=Chromobacterium violaceum TaxID=536 RepID=UPI0005BADF3B|nr:hypothetical protein [Chromobacterium violaceum]